MHGHIDITSQDCDGRYSRSYVRTYDNYGQAFLDHVQGRDGGLEFTKYGFSTHEVTEEGFVRKEVTFCDDPRCADDKPTYRDHRAEAAGY